MIGFYHGSSLPAKESLKSGIYFIVSEGKGKLYRVLADAADPVLVAETTDASLIADVAKAKEDIQKNATSVASAIASIKKITDLHGETLKNITDEASAIRTLAQGAADQAATNKNDITTANTKIKANADAISAIKDGATIDSFKDVEDALDGKQAAGDYATKEQAQGYANAAAKAVDDKLGFIPDETNATLKAYVDKRTEGIASEEAMTQLAGRVTVIENDYLKGEDKTELSSAIALKADQTALQEEVNRAKGEETRIEGLVTTEASRADTEEKRIVGLVEAEESRATAAEEALDGRLDKVETFFQTTEGGQLDTALDTLVEIQTYIKSEGAAADEMVKNIAANAKAIEDMDKAYKAADTTLQNAINGVEGRVTTAEGEIDALQAKFTGNGDGTVAKMISDAVAAEAALREAGVTEAKNAASAADAKAQTAQDEVDALEIVVAGKAAQTDLTALQNRVKTVEDEINTESTGLKARMTTAEGEIDALQADLNTASTGIKDRLTAVETKATNNASAIATNASDIATLMAALEWKQA